MSIDGRNFNLHAPANKSRKWLRKALERPDEWTDEARARAQHRLGQVLCLMDKKRDAGDFLQSAQATRHKIWKTHATYLSTSTEIEDCLYDHLVPFEAGRSTLGKFHLTIPKTPKLNDICRMLNERLLSVDKDVLSPSELCSILKLNVVTPIEEPFTLAPK